MAVVFKDTGERLRFQHFFTFSFLMGLSQIRSYAFFGLLHNELWSYGLALGVGATLGNIIGKRFLSNMKSSTFRRLVIALMAISGILLIYGQLRTML